MLKTIEEKVDDAVHAALGALGVNPLTCPDLADSLKDWLTEQAPRYITDDEDDDEGEPEPPIFMATFIGQAWMRDHAYEVDDSRWTFPVTAKDIRELTVVDPDDYEKSDALIDAIDADPYQRDELRGSASAPKEAKDWSGPFEIELEPFTSEETP